VNTWPYFYKFFRDDQLSCAHAPERWQRGWMPRIEGDLKPSHNGYHCVTPDGLINWLAPIMWRVEVRGDWMWKDEGKVIVVREARLHSQVGQWNERTQRLIAAMFAQLAVDRHWTDQSDLRPQQAIDAARNRANGVDCNWTRAGIAATAAARAAALAADRTGFVAGIAATAAARSAALGADRDAATDAVRSAAGLLYRHSARPEVRKELNNILICLLRREVIPEEQHAS